MLIYIGNGAALPDVPARDLVEADVNTIAVLWDKDPGVVASELKASGLYEQPAKPKAKAEKE